MQNSTFSNNTGLVADISSKETREALLISNNTFTAARGGAVLSDSGSLFLNFSANLVNYAASSSSSLLCIHGTNSLLVLANSFRQNEATSVLNIHDTPFQLNAPGLISGNLFEQITSSGKGGGVALTGATSNVLL